MSEIGLCFPWYRLEQNARANIRCFEESYFGDTRPDAWHVLPKGLWDLPHVEQLLEPWSLYDWPVDGFPLADWFLEKRHRRLSSWERRWVQAQLSTSLSLWRVKGVDALGTLALEDLLTRDLQPAVTTAGDFRWRPGDHLLARVVSWEPISVMVGVHPHPLDAKAAMQLRRTLKGQLRVSARATLPRYLLRDGETGLLLLDLWEKESAAQANALPLEPGTTQDLPRCDVTDVYHLANPEQFLLKLDSWDAATPVGGTSAAWLLTLPPRSRRGRRHALIVGELRLSGERLRLRARGTDGAELLGAALCPLLPPGSQHLGRLVEDPLSAAHRPTRESAPPSDEAAPGRNALWWHGVPIAQWVDHGLDRLGGQSPRAAVRHPQGRREVEAMLRQLENGQARVPEPLRIDTRALRDELGLPEG